MANILICDDERDIVSALKIYLSSEGYTLFDGTPLRLSEKDQKWPCFPKIE